MCEWGAIRDERLELPDGICVAEAIWGSKQAENNLATNFVGDYFQKNGRYRRSSRQDIKLQGLAGEQRQSHSAQAASAVRNTLRREPQLLLH